MLIQATIILYFMLGAFFAGYHYKESDVFGWSHDTVWLKVGLVALFVAFGPIIYFISFFETSCKMIFKEFDAITNLKFYWIYLRGGFYNVDQNRLIHFDRQCFKREYNKLTSIRDMHFIYVSNLIFKRNGYTRKQWAVDKNNMIYEVKR